MSFAGFVRDHCVECHDAYMLCKMDPRGPQDYVQPDCCKATEKFYSRQPGLLKREFAADRFVVTSAKTYAMDNVDGEMKRGIKGNKLSVNCIAINCKLKTVNCIAINCKL